MIEIKNLKKTYFKGKQNEIKVINDTTLSLPDKGLISFLGPSGSGKTTFLNTIGGLDKADSGSISYDDLSMNKYRMERMDKYRRENFGYVFQNYLLMDDLSVYENLRLALEINDVTEKEEVKKRIEYALTSVGLYKFRKKLAGTLSGGQQQRVSIARCLVKKCRVIIADEPTGNLDSENTIEVMNILKKISKNSLVLLVTHNENIAEFYSDKIVYLKDGTVLECKDNEAKDSLEGLEDGKIHLLDYEKKDIASDGLTLKVYSDKESDLQDVTIVIKNNTIYIDSKSRIEVVKDSGTKIVADHKESLKKEDIENFSYDNTWYKDGKRKNPFISFLKDLGRAFRDFYQNPKKKKVFSVIFTIIGILLAVLVLFQTNYTSVPSEYIKDFADEDVSILEGTRGQNTGFTRQMAEEAVSGGYITDVIDSGQTQVSLRINSVRDTMYSCNAYRYSLSYLGDSTMLAGEKKKVAGFYVIGRKLADDMISSFGGGYSYSDLIGLNVFGTSVISGVSSKDTRGIYGIFDTDYGYHWYSYDDKSTPVIDNGVDYALMEGRKPSGFKEVIVPYASTSYSLGDTVTYGGIEMTVVGIYKTESSSQENPYVANESPLVSKETYLAYRISSGMYSSSSVFKLGNLDKVQDFFNEYSITVHENAYSYSYQTALENNKSSRNIYFIIEAVLLSVILIYTYFSERSRMIAEVHDIGVLRSLGARRHSIISRSLKEIFAKATLTTLLGYVIVLVIYYFLAGRLNAITGTSTLSFSMTYSILGLIILYLSQLLIGIIPLLTLLHKTPSEINSKYDI